MVSRTNEVASRSKSCERVTSPLQLVTQCCRQRCETSCRKCCIVWRVMILSVVALGGAFLSTGLISWTEEKKLPCPGLAFLLTIMTMLATRASVGSLEGVFRNYVRRMSFSCSDFPDGLIGHLPWKSCAWPRRQQQPYAPGELRWLPVGKMPGIRSELWSHSIP